MTTTWSVPGHIPLVGEFVTLRPADYSRDSAALYSVSHSDAELESVWGYLSYGPFASTAELEDHYVKTLTGQADTLPWTIIDRANEEPVGVVAVFRIVPDHGRAEIGHVRLSRKVLRSKINTETQYLLLKYLLDEMKYRRVEWKCNSENHVSRSAASRMGFVYEGRFRQHWVSKGKNRDTDWFSMIDKDWPQCRKNLEKWLYGSDPVSLNDLNWGVSRRTNQ